MAFDGITIAAIVKELNTKLLGGRLYKIAQPEKDELLITVKNEGNQYRLVLSADASLPLVYLTQENKKSPMTAPNFCMLLRKHVQNGRIVKIEQPGLERIIRFEIEHLDEMGDLRHKTLVMELMGKHSNIIFHDERGMILDSIKHISSMVSSVREVLPGRIYFIPETMDKIDPVTGVHHLGMNDGKNRPEMTTMGKNAFQEAENVQNIAMEKENGSAGVSFEVFCTQIVSRVCAACKAVYGGFTGISPIVAQEICHRAGVDGDHPSNALSERQMKALFDAFDTYIGQVREGTFTPLIVYKGVEPVEFGVFEFTIYDAGFESFHTREFDSISEVLRVYYAEKSMQTRMRQKSVDLRKIVSTALERNVKKYDLQLRQLKDTEKREKYKVYGELLHTYGYQAAEGDKSITVENYYTQEMITIPLDKSLSAMENAKKYFDKYGKLKRTYEALSTLTKETKDEIDHLESVMNALDIAQDETDLKQIKEELVQSGYIRFKGGQKKEKLLSRPMHFVSSDGFDMYVGKNNFQNEEITFQLAQGNDWWFHAKGMPGSHVIVKSGGKELPDRTFEEAGRLAAYYSKAKGRDKIEIDYVERKHVKKPGGGKPGFVVYYTNYSLLIDADISQIRRVE